MSRDSERMQYGQASKGSAVSRASRERINRDHGT